MKGAPGKASEGGLFRSWLLLVSLFGITNISNVLTMPQALMLDSAVLIHSVPLRKWQLEPAFYSCGPETLRHLPKATQLVSGRVGIQTPFAKLQVCTFNHHFVMTCG